MDENEETLLRSLRERMSQLAINMEKMKLAEYVDLLENPWKLLWVNFTSGIARGLGIAVGFAILGAVIIIILQYLVRLNLPLIGGFIAEIVSIVQAQLGQKPGF